MNAFNWRTTATKQTRPAEACTYVRRKLRAELLGVAPSRASINTETITPKDKNWAIRRGSI